MARLVRLTLGVVVGVPCVLVALVVLPAIGAAAVLVACVRGLARGVRQRSATAHLAAVERRLEQVETPESEQYPALTAQRERVREQALASMLAYSEACRRGQTAVWWN